MGQKIRNKKAFTKGKVNKGAPSGLVISLAVHAAAFFLAGLFVVFTVLPKEEPEFQAPPPVERPKMKLKKPKVKIKKSSQPKPSSRIVAKVKTAKMPEIQIPDLVGTGEGLLGGLGIGDGDFMDIPDIEEITIFGGGQSTGSDLKGVYYDLNRRRNGNILGIEATEEFGTALSKFVSSGCDKRAVSKYYRSNPLYAVGVMIPTILSPAGPAAFGQDYHDAKPQGWFVHYEGKLVHPTDIRFRFWGSGDDMMIVLIDKKVVLSNKYNSSRWTGNLAITPGWRPTANENDRYWLGWNKATVGGWIDLKGGETHDLDILIGESPGGHFHAMLCVEEDGVDYETNVQGGPILPMFKTDELSWAQRDAIYEYLTPGEACLTNGPIFRDY